MASPHIGENYGGLHNLDYLSKNLAAELPDGYSLAPGACGNVAVTLWAELLSFRLQLAQFLAAVLDFLRKISKLLQEETTSTQMVGSHIPVSPEGPLSRDAAQTGIGRAGISRGPRPPLTATEHAFRKDNFLGHFAGPIGGNPLLSRVSEWNPKSCLLVPRRNPKSCLPVL